MEPSTDERVLFRVELPAAIVTLNDPEARNALSPDMVAALSSSFDRIEREPQIQVVILTGAGKVFSAGADLRVLGRMQHHSVEQGRQDSLLVGRLLRRIYLFPKPVIAAVNGHAIAGGCGLMSVCDLALAVPEAKFSYPEVKVGFIPAMVGVFLVRQVGEKIARELLLTGKVIEAGEARRCGLINEIVPADQLLARARQLAVELASNSPEAMQLTKEMLAHQHGAGLDEALELALDMNSLVRSTGNFREGITAFLEKRKPKWR